MDHVSDNSTPQIDSDQQNQIDIFIRDLIQEAHGLGLPDPLRDNMRKDLEVLFEEQLSNAIVHSLPKELQLDAVEVLQNGESIEKFFYNHQEQLTGVPFSQLIQDVKEQFRADYLATTAKFVE